MIQQLDRTKFILVLIILGFFGQLGFSLLFKVILPEYWMPAALPTFLFLILPLITLRRKAKPEEFPFLTKERLPLIIAILIVVMALLTVFFNTIYK